MPSVFLLGASGYLGGTTLTDLESAGEFDVTCLVRSGRDDLLRGRKAKALIGSHEDLAVIEETCSKMDIVINAATSDDLELTRAINRGLKAGKAAGYNGILVHISGTQLIESRPSGTLEDVPKYDDLDVEQIAAISDNALHRLIDLEVIRADLAGEIIGSIICPGVIFGRGSGPGKTVSSPLPNLVRLALRHKQITYAADGTNIWCHVHVRDVSDLIMLSLRHNLAASQPAGWNRFYFAENGEHQKLQLSKDLAALLYGKGLISSSVPLSVSPDDLKSPSWANKTTSRCFANRARKELDWVPKIDLETTFEAEISDILDTVLPEFVK